MQTARLYIILLVSFFFSVTTESLDAQTIIHVPQYTFDGDSAGDNFGESVGSAGDVNGDGTPDLIVGAPLDDNNGEDSGSVRILSGSDASVLYSFDGDNEGGQFGFSVSGAGDVNGDGTPDLIIGAPFDPNNGISTGSARVLSGSDGSILYTFYGDSLGDRFGWSVSGGGDVNGDGTPDLIVGAPRNNNSGDLSGTTRVLSGSDGSVLYNFDGNSSGDSFGQSVSNAGDVNGDGRADVIVGAPLDDNNGIDSGSARVLSGSDGSVLYNFDGDNYEDQFGYSVSGAGDVNGDGIDDLIVGVRQATTDRFQTGIARVLSGSDGSILYTFDGDGPIDAYGSSVSAVGDVNGDGTPDLIVGAPFDNNSGFDSGSARVQSGIDGSVLYSISGESSNQFFGCSVSGAGDLNGDGIDDFIVGARAGGANGGGYARVFVSQTILDSDNPIAWETPITITSDTDISNLGGPIHLAADFNTPETFNPENNLLFIQGDFDGVINGIQFTGTGIVQSIAGSLTTNFRSVANASTFLNGGQGAFYRGAPTGDVDLDNLLDSHSFGTETSSGQITIEGLNVGTDYQVQLIAIADGRPFAVDSILRVGNGAGQLTGPTLTRELYQTVTGRFTADSTSQSILIEPILGGGPGLSGIVVQAVPDLEFLLGDCNLDGVVNFLDISPFILVLSNGDFLNQADTNEDGVVNFLDISSFIALLSSQP